MKDDRVTFRINSTTKQKWEVEAGRRDISVSALIAIAVSQYLTK